MRVETNVHTTLMDNADARVESQAVTVTDVMMDILDMDRMLEAGVKVAETHFGPSHLSAPHISAQNISAPHISAPDISAQHTFRPQTFRPNTHFGPGHFGPTHIMWSK